MMFGKMTKKHNRYIKSDSTVPDAERDALYYHSYVALPSDFLRDSEIENVKEWIGEKRVVVLHGRGGAGKSTFLKGLCEKRYVNKIAYYDLKDRQSFSIIAKSILRELFLESAVDEGSLLERIAFNIKNNQVLIVLDNLESVMCVGEKSGTFAAEYSQYQELVNLFFNVDSRNENGKVSTLILSGRDKYKVNGRIDHTFWADFELAKLTIEQAKILLKQYSLVGLEQDWTTLIDYYNSNLLELRLAGAKICEEYNHNIRSYLISHEIPLEINDLLEEQFKRFTQKEQYVLFLLAIERREVTKEEIFKKIVKIYFSPAEFERSLNNLQYRSFADYDSELHLFTLQPVILEFLVQKLTNILIEEITTGQVTNYLALIPFLDLEAKDYILVSQKNIFVKPLVDAIIKIHGEMQFVNYVKIILSKISVDKDYACGNIINMLSMVYDRVEKFDFSNKYIIYADLRFNDFINCSFRGATFDRILFKQTFGTLVDVQFSHDDSLILGGATDYSINIWDSQSLNFVDKINCHTDWVRSVDINDEYIVSASNDETISIIDRSMKNVVAHYKLDSRARKVQLSKSNDGIVYASGDDQKIHIIDIKNNTHTELSGHSKVVWDLAVSSVDNTDSFIISASDDGTVMLWDIYSQEREVLLDINAADADVNNDGKKVEFKSIAYDGNDLIFVGSDNGCIISFSLKERKIKHITTAHDGAVWGLDYRNNKLLSGAADGLAILWNCLDDGLLDCIKVLDAHNSTVWQVNFNGDGTRFVTTGDDGCFKVWDVQSCNTLYAINGYTNLLRHISVSLFRKQIYVCGDDKRIYEYDDDNNYQKSKRKFIGHLNRVRSVDISEDGKYMVSCGDDGLVILWDLRTGGKVEYKGHSNRVWTVCFISEKIFASAGESDEILIWSIESTEYICKLSGHTDWIWDLNYNKEINCFVSASEDKTCILWDAETFKCKKMFSGHSKWLFCASISQDGTHIITGSADGTAKIYDVNSGEQLYSLNGHDEWVWSAIFLSNDLVATGGKDSTIRIWKLYNEPFQYKCLHILKGHNSWVVSMAHIPETSRLFSCSADETVKVWDTNTFECINEFHIDKPYDGSDISDVCGLSNTVKESLLRLGAIEKN